MKAAIYYKCRESVTLLSRINARWQTKTLDACNDKNV